MMMLSNERICSAVRIFSKSLTEPSGAGNTTIVVSVEAKRDRAVDVNSWQEFSPIKTTIITDKKRGWIFIKK
jgi:hypothetical protein